MQSPGAADRVHVHPHRHRAGPDRGPDRHHRLRVGSSRTSTSERLQDLGRPRLILTLGTPSSPPRREPRCAAARAPPHRLTGDAVSRHPRWGPAPRGGGHPPGPGRSPAAYLGDRAARPSRSTSCASPAGSRDAAIGAAWAVEVAQGATLEHPAAHPWPCHRWCRRRGAVHVHPGRTPTGPGAWAAQPEGPALRAQRRLARDAGLRRAGRRRRSTACCSRSSPRGSSAASSPTARAIPDGPAHLPDHDRLREVHRGARAGSAVMNIWLAGIVLTLGWALGLPEQALTS